MILWSDVQSEANVLFYDFIGRLITGFFEGLLIKKNGIIMKILH